MKDITGTRELNYAELEQRIEEAEDCMTQNDELMQLLDQVIKLQDKMIADLYKQVEDLENCKPPFRKLVPKPVYTDEDKLNILKDKIQNFHGAQG